jgi:peptidoglycan hydrolase-like protein with peptidoglycan-binding domain
MSTQLQTQTKAAQQPSFTPVQTGILQRKCACGQHTVAGGECAGCCQKREGMMQRAAISAAPVSTVLPIVHDVLASSGRPLDAGAQAFMEPRFGHDFSQVRVHTDGRAAESARAVNALAYTVGRDVVFGVGQYAPGTSEGKRLLAHELAHVVQQYDRPSLQRRLEIGPTNDHYEQEADWVSGQVMQGSMISGLLPASVSYIQRQAAKHNLTATRFIGNAILEEVYDGKRLLRNGDSGVAVRLIQESLIAQGFALPVFGADSKFGSETERAVRAFQVATGAKKLDGIVGPETMQLLNMHDPLGTTATGPAAGGPAIGPALPPATAAVFSELPEEQFAGFDASVAPNWLFVPVNGRREVKVAVVPAIARPSFVSLNTSVATVTTTPLGIEVTGVANGTTDIQAKQGATILAPLKIRVKSRRDLTVDYHFMRDSVVPPHHTTRSPGQASKLTATLNRIWERQANVRFTTGTVNSPVVPGNLGPVVLWNASPALDEWHLVTAFATGGNYNVFLVWEFEEDATPFVDDADAGTLGSNTLLEDHECPDGLTIAHEAGHFLGLAPAAHPPSGIMSACGGATPERVSKADTDVVNP